MRELLTFQKITTEKQWESIRLFAKSFRHNIDDSTLTPLVAIRRGQKLFGYFCMSSAPIFFPSFHPDETTPRDFVEAVQQIRAYAWISTTGHERFPLGVCLTAFDRDPVIDKRLIEKLGFRDTGCALWESYPP